MFLYFELRIAAKIRKFSSNSRTLNIKKHTGQSFAKGSREGLRNGSGAGLIQLQDRWPTVPLPVSHDYCS
jgi:hypothetical protein